MDGRLIILRAFGRIRDAIARWKISLIRDLSGNSIVLWLLIVAFVVCESLRAISGGLDQSSFWNELVRSQHTTMRRDGDINFDV